MNPLKYLLFLPVMCLVSGCAPGLTGFAWELDLNVIEDTCQSSGSGYSDHLQYVVNYDGSRVDLAIGPDTFANGTLAGCGLSYQSVAWQTEVDGATLRWQIDGEAEHTTQPGSCGLVDGLDWVGTETFTILNSDHPYIPAGCQIRLSVEGVFAESFQ